ncbi:MAG TPA: malto-oligosyltrehalose trehalohydrolase, partial [Halanaerobiales bacterium]|nr:malto-oligosyltrehalose trehalohydrolase [Halanaerobiales bacterium]
MSMQMGAVISSHQKKKVRFTAFAFKKEKVSLIVRLNKIQREIPLPEIEPDLYSREISLPELTDDESYSFSSNPVLYKFSLDGKAFPDPYSAYQPEGVHGFSRLIDHQQYQWQDLSWRGRELEEFIIMELHVGTFSRAGNFKGLQNKLDYLIETGINTIELMPVTQTPGRWNWGYDGTGLFTVNHNYGTPDELKELIDTCHRKGLAVLLDVVYNHFGPEGNYLPAYGPYFTEKYLTPWGPAVNFDDDFCQYTRKMVLDNVRYWLEEFHFDGLRLDAVQAIRDHSPVHILKEIAATVKKTARELNRRLYVIAETDRNDVRLINPQDKGGYGIDAQWMDDFHHCIHTVLTGEREGYYVDYGRLNDFKKVYKNYLYTGEYSKYWNKRRGSNARNNPGKQFVVAIQNHDQVGNRARGERLNSLLEFSHLKLAAALLFFSPYIPLLFMGEEYGEENPFLFFTDYGEPRLQRAVTEGRREEFADFTWEDVPDPQAEKTFYQSRLTP